MEAEKRRLRKRISDKQDLINALTGSSDPSDIRELERQRNEKAGLERELASLS